MMQSGDSAPISGALQRGTVTHSVQVESYMTPPPAQKYFLVLRSDAENEIRKYVEYANRFDFVTPVAILITIGLTLATATFHPLLNQTADFWKAFYTLVGLWCLGRIVILGIRWWRNRPMTVENLVECILHISSEGISQ